MRFVSALFDFGTAIIGEYFDAALVMQLEQLRHQIADGVIAQIGGNIADAQPAAAQIDRGMAAVTLSVMRAIPGRPLDIAIGGGELQQRIVGIGRHGKRIDAAEQGLAVEKLRRRRDRPFALRQAQGGILLDDVGLPRIDVQALLDGFFRLLALLRGGQDARNLRQRGCRIVNGDCR